MLAPLQAANAPIPRSGNAIADAVAEVAVALAEEARRPANDAPFYEDMFEACKADAGGPSGRAAGRDVNVIDASLWPEQTAAGAWPADWTLSDHAMVTCTFESM